MGGKEEGLSVLCLHTTPVGRESIALGDVRAERTSPHLCKGSKTWFPSAWVWVSPSVHKCLF